MILSPDRATVLRSFDFKLRIRLQLRCGKSTGKIANSPNPIPFYSCMGYLTAQSPGSFTPTSTFCIDLEPRVYPISLQLKGMKYGLETTGETGYLFRIVVRTITIGISLLTTSFISTSLPLYKEFLRLQTKRKSSMWATLKVQLSLS